MAPYLGSETSVSSDQTHVHQPRLYTTADPNLADLKKLVDRTTSKSICPSARRISSNVPIYSGKDINPSNTSQVQNLQEEWYNTSLHGPGVLVIEDFYQDLSIIDSANAAYTSIIQHEKASNPSKGDHFSAGANDRIWNSFSKHCLQDPSSFLEYYSNPLIKLIAEAYLGPAYRVTAQVNIVKPGGKAQMCHRDYHLGFQTAEDVSKWPRAMHHASQLLTLQGAVAHCDMPPESGPTRLLPWSQMYGPGFVAYRLEEFQEYFLEKYVSLPLKKGDAIFFNPALFHAAGENVSRDLERSANLLQISSAFGKTMERVDTLPLVDKVWEDLVGKFAKERVSAEVEAFVAAVTEGYPFPTNLDRRPPAPNGMAPESEADVVRRALREGWSREKVVGVLRGMSEDAEA